MLTKLLNLDFNARLKARITGGRNVTPLISVVVPIHNQEKNIQKHLKSIVDEMHYPFELLLVNDASNDRTEDENMNFISKVKNSKMTNIFYFKTFWPWYETKCDDFAIRKSAGKYIIEIQSDMLISEPNFDKKLIDALETDESLFAISARGTCNLKRVYTACVNEERRGSLSAALLKLYYRQFRKNIASFRTASKVSYKTHQVDFENVVEKIFPHDNLAEQETEAGFLDLLIQLLPYEDETYISKNIKKNLGKVWIGETIMRGPLIFERERYLRIGGLNTEAFFLGHDDQELVLKAKQFGYKVGFSPIRFSSPLSLGSTRAEKRLSSKTWNVIHGHARKKQYKDSFLYKTSLRAVSNVG